MWEKLEKIVGAMPDGSKAQALILMEILYWARERGLWKDKEFWSLISIFLQIQKDADLLLMEAASQEIGH